MATNKICGVSILRAGETMEQAVCDVCKDIRIGKILIQTNLHTGEPEVQTGEYLVISCYKVFVSVILSQVAKRHKGLQGHINGCNSSNGSCGNDGNTCITGSRCCRE